MPPRSSSSPSWVPFFAFTGFLALMIFGLVMVVRMIPERKPPVTTTPPPVLEVVPTQGDQVRCEKAGGKWTECGSPCHGKPGEVCATVCEAHCLCGGASKWTCPTDLTCQDYEPANSANGIGVCRTGKPVVTAPTSTTPTTTPVSIARPIPEGMICDETHSICINKEDMNAKAANPIVIRGSGIAFENTISWELHDGYGVFISRGFTTADAPDVGQPGNFEVKTFLPVSVKTATGTLRVFESSAKDGLPIHVVEVPLNLQTKTMPVSFYYSDEKAAAAGDCTQVKKVVTQIPYSTKPIEATLRSFLSMAFTDYSSLLDEDTIKTVVLKNGVLTLTMNNRFGYLVGGGSCKVAAVRAELEAVAKQFPSVKSVVIQEEGKTPEETLQP